MFLADVVGTVVSPVAIPVLEGRTLLVVRPVTPDGRRAGPARVAIDRVAAGEGDRVLCVDEGNAGRQLLGTPDGAVKTVVVGVVDYVEREGEHVYDARTREPVVRMER
jgi:microcompartment protein CcmK/EutM